MKMEITENDKKLLYRLGFFVIVVVIGYWGVFPQIKGMKEAGEKIEIEEAKKIENDFKIAQIPMLTKDTDDLEKQILEDREDYYSMMGSDVIDKYFTTMVLKHNLYSYDLKISMPEDDTDLKPYQYSAKAQNKVEDPEEIEEKGYYERLDEEMNHITGDVSFEDNDKIETGIKEATVSMRLGGSEDDLKTLLEDLFKEKKKLRVEKYTWREDNIMIQSKEGGLEMKPEIGLDVVVTIYMCEE